MKKNNFAFLPTLPDGFPYDVFLSHRAKDKAMVRSSTLSASTGERARVRASQTEGELERSRVLVLCMSANVFGSDWARLESGPLRFRDPLNKERRFPCSACHALF